jgi:hypothetical protein
MAMYFFEFEYTFDQDDLSYIWQNIAPRNYKQISKQTSATAHSFGNNELLSKQQILDPNLRWMVFKVKQRSQVQYNDLITPQAGQSTPVQDKTSNYKTEFNWPYDYVSFVETIKVGAEVLYKKEASVNTSAFQATETGTNDANATTATSNLQTATAGTDNVSTNTGFGGVRERER